MTKLSPEKFFEILGETWRDICLIEFLMRCAIAQKNGDVSKFPQPPYLKDAEYDDFPESFALPMFGDVVMAFNKLFPKLAIPQDLVDLRNAMAHGLVIEINHDGVDRLIKFRKQKSGKLKVEFSLTLETIRIESIRTELRNLRRFIAKEAGDK